MFSTLPNSAQEFMHWPWSQIEPYYQELLDRPLDAQTGTQWLSDWTRLIDLLSEKHARLSVATTLNTTDKAAETRYNEFLDGIHQASQTMNQKLKEKLLASGLTPEGFAIQLRKMHSEAALFRTENLPLLSEETKLGAEYNRIVGAQTVTWEGEELTVQQLRKVLHSPNRQERERAWKLAAARWQQDRPALNQVWIKMMNLRRKLAANASLPDYRAYRWQQLLRLDYTPENCQEFQQAIEQVAVPAASRLYEAYRQSLGVASVRPWDLDLDRIPMHSPALPPYGDTATLEEKAEAIFSRLDAQLGAYFHTMRQEKLLDLENRKGKAPGAYCTSYPAARRPYIFMNAVGLHDDIRTILHESGHAFHGFERFKLPYAQQRLSGMEFNEVASMAMELLAAPFVAVRQGGFYEDTSYRRFRIAHLEQVLTFWPYMAVVDAFQHWVYTHHDQACNPDNCDAAWMDLWQRFMPGVDWSGLEAETMTGWHRKQHIFRSPFYYVEYGLAQLGAVQIWRNALQDPARALVQYRYALSLGGTADLTGLYQAAGVKFAFDPTTLGEAVRLIEDTIAALGEK